jgi:hypothetical protein
MKNKNERIKYLEKITSKVNNIKNTTENETKIFLIELILYNMNSRIITLKNDDGSVDDILDDILENDEVIIDDSCTSEGEISDPSNNYEACCQ